MKFKKLKHIKFKKLKLNKCFSYFIFSVNYCFELHECDSCAFTGYGVCIKLLIFFNFFLNICVYIYIYIFIYLVNFQLFGA